MAGVKLSLKDDPTVPDSQVIVGNGADTIVGSEEQEAIWHELLTGSRPVIVSAVAGSGKTYTIVEYAKREKKAKVGLVAFNKHIATELQQRMGGQANVKCLTYHSLGYQACLKAFRRCEVDQHKVYGILDSLHNTGDRGRDAFVKGRTKALVGLAKQYGFETPELLRGIADEHALDIGSDEYTEDLIVDLAGRVLEQSAAQTRTVDFDDQVWLPYKLGLELPKFDTLCVDECFIGDTPIMLDENQRMSIRALVDSQYGGKIATYKDGKTVYRNVIGWHKKAVRGPMLRFVIRQIGLRKDGRRLKPESEITNYGNKFVICTKDHKFFRQGSWVCAHDLRVGDRLITESHAPKDHDYNHRYKHGRAGLDHLGSLMTQKNQGGLCGHSRGNTEGPKIRGGNGQVSEHEEALAERLGPKYIRQYAIPTMARSKGLDMPTCYKIDFADPESMIAIELDGNSHFSRREQDKKKDLFLASLGWTVLRLSNEEVLSMQDDALHMLVANSPVEAEVISIEPWFPHEPYVYDITVEDTHCYYANGVLVHNCQDLNLVQQQLALRAAQRLVLIGDPGQSIYRFRGADSRSFDRMKSMLPDVVTLPLTLTRRCPVKHVELAQRIVPQIRAMENAPLGRIVQLDLDKALAAMLPGDLVLCRVNAPLVGTAYCLIQRGVKAIVRGRDIGRGLGELLDKSVKRSKGSSLDLVMGAAYDLTLQLRDRYASLPHGRGDSKVAAVMDKWECLNMIAGQSGSVEEVRKAIDEIFGEFDAEGKPKDAVVLGTVHRTKGLESNRVFVLRGELIPHPMAKEEEDVAQELNIAYIAVTRAKFDLAAGKAGELFWAGPVPKLFT